MTPREIMLEIVNAEEVDDLVDPETYAYPHPLGQVSRDLKRAAATLSLQEVRYLVDLYYEAQHYRIASSNQVRALRLAEPEPEPESLLVWARTSFDLVEVEIRRGLDVFSRSEPTGLGLWLRSIVGIGPVIAAGLLAHVQPSEKTSVGQIWRFAGLDPTDKWERGEKRPWNASLKVLTYKAGESFVKVQSNKNDVYGTLYAQRKRLEVERNEGGMLREQAELALSTRAPRKETEAYKAYVQGKLPPAHIHARARRWAVKIFLAHYYEVGYFLVHGTLPPLPYVLTHLGHVDWMAAPNAELIPGLPEAQAELRKTITGRLP